MTPTTDQLIARLAATPPSVERVPPPARRAATWVALASLYVLVVVFAFAPRDDLRARLADPSFLLGVAGALATAFVAATAAFATSVPGYNGQRRALLILLPLGWGAWLLGSALVAAIANPPAASGAECFAAVIAFGGVPAMTIALMLRRGAPLTPGSTLALGTLAATALGDAALRFCHGADGAAHLLWHAAAVTLLVIAAAKLGPRVLRWRLATGG